MKKLINGVIILFLLASLFLVTSASTFINDITFIPAKIKNQGSSFDSSNVILFLPTLIKYESVSNEMEMDNKNEKLQMKNYLEGQIILTLDNKGYNLKMMDQLSKDSVGFEAELLVILENYDSMFKSYPDTFLINKVIQFGEKSKIKTLLIFKCDVKIGTGGSWNSYSGQITSSNNRTIFKSVLIDTSNGSKIWSNSAQLRKLPNYKDLNFEKEINSIFENFKK
jgi:hypothetical protein